MFTEMYPRMVRYASQLMGDGEEARDIVSEVMEQAWKHFDQLDEADRGGWIYTAVRNTCLNRMKHLQVERDRKSTRLNSSHPSSSRMPSSA